MKPQEAFQKLKKNGYFLLENYVKESLLFSALVVGLQILPERRLELNLLLLPLSILTGLWAFTFIHQACHGNLGKFNRFFGELYGAWLLTGFTTKFFTHALHHEYSFENFDPFYPGGKTFRSFFFSIWSGPNRLLKNWLKLRHGHVQGYKFILSLQVGFFYLNILLRALTWFLLLGRDWFLFFYVPSVITSYLLEAHIHFVGNRNDERGQSVRVNLNHNAYFKLINLLTFGSYFYRNHHSNVSYFNPTDLDETLFHPHVRRFYRGGKISRYLAMNDVWGEGKKNKLPKMVRIRIPRDPALSQELRH